MGIMVSDTRLTLYSILFGCHGLIACCKCLNGRSNPDSMIHADKHGFWWSPRKMSQACWMRHISWIPTNVKRWSPQLEISAVWKFLQSWSRSIRLVQCLGKRLKNVLTNMANGDWIQAPFVRSIGCQVFVIHPTDRSDHATSDTNSTCWWWESDCAHWQSVDLRVHVNVLVSWTMTSCFLDVWGTSAVRLLCVHLTSLMRLYRSYHR